MSHCIEGSSQVDDHTHTRAVRWLPLVEACLDVCAKGSNDLGQHVVEPSGDKRRCSSQRVFCLGSVSSGLTDPHFDHRAAARTPTGPNQTPAPSDGGQRTSKSRPYFQVPLSCMYPQRHSILIRLQMKTTTIPCLRLTYVSLKKDNWDRYR